MQQQQGRYGAPPLCLSCLWCAVACAQRVRAYCEEHRGRSIIVKMLMNASVEQAYADMNDELATLASDLTLAVGIDTNSRVHQLLNQTSAHVVRACSALRCAHTHATMLHGAVRYLLQGR